MRDDIVGMISHLDALVNEFVAGDAQNTDKQEVSEFQQEKDERMEKYLKAIAQLNDELAKDLTILKARLERRLKQ